MAPKSFSKQISDLTAKYEARMLYVARSATQELIRRAQLPIGKGGHMPVDTGFLRNSLETSLMGGTAIVGPDSYGVALSTLKIGDTVRFTWTAAYALFVHYGTRNMQGRFWATLAAQQWHAIVSEKILEAKQVYP